jgi:hypothetical protein
MKDMKAAVAKPRWVALYARMDSDWYTVWEVEYSDRDEHYQLLPDGQLREVPVKGYVRITEPVAVEFRAIDNDEVVARAVESLNESERALLSEMSKKLAEIRERKSQLLALTAPQQDAQS